MQLESYKKKSHQEEEGQGSTVGESCLWKVSELALQKQMHLRGAASLHEESTPIWGSRMRKSLYVIGLSVKSVLRSLHDEVNVVLLEVMS
jgi:hypothetical protein